MIRHLVSQRRIDKPAANTALIQLLLLVGALVHTGGVSPTGGTQLSPAERPLPARGIPPAHLAIKVAPVNACV